MKKIVSILGARPQFIKAGVVSEQLQAAGLLEVMIHTGQHYDANMSDVFFEELGLPAPKYNLGIGGGSHAEMTGRQLIEVERCLQTEMPDLVLVYGDTNSTLAGALAAVKMCIPVAHVEAGLRSHNMAMPEEINRVITDRVSALLFSPSSNATQNLLREGVPASRIVEVGDVMYDAALRYGGGSAIGPNKRDGAFVVTIHRAENTDHAERLRVIVDGLVRLASCAPTLFPVHPRTRRALERAGLWQRLAAAVRITEPLGYIEMLTAMRQARAVVTDSGGVQKEAYFMGTPCVTVRDETEWTETVTLGWNRLVVPLSAEALAQAAMAATVPPARGHSPYGDGRAAVRIAQRLLLPL